MWSGSDDDSLSHVVRICSVRYRARPKLLAMAFMASRFEQSDLLSKQSAFQV